MIISTISQGFLWAILGLGIYMTFRILNFPDMTAEGSFPLGGAVAVTLITQGVNPYVATGLAVLAGCLAGLASGLLYTKGKIPTLLAGILVMTSCHSIMLMIMGRANIGLLNARLVQDVLPFSNEVNSLLLGLLFVIGVIASLTLLAGILVTTSCHSIMLMIMGRANLGLLNARLVQDVLPFSNEVNSLLLGLLFVIGVIASLIFFLNTRLGQAYIATGDNPDMARSFGINTDQMELMGLVLSNGIIALAGALIAQQEGYADVSRGIGVIVIGLASIIIGEVMFGNLTMLERFITIVLGAIFYQVLILAVIALGFNTSYLRLFSAIILAVCLMVPHLKQQITKGGRLSK